MAADISLEREQIKPCCASWKDKYSKLEERRKALRQAVKLLEQQADKFQLDNINLKKAYEEEQSRAKIEREESAKISDVFTAQEKEISSLKSEVFVLKQRNNSSFEDVDKKLLQERICEAEIEITDLKELLKMERKKIVVHKKESTVNKVITFPSDDAEKSILRVRVSDCEGEINKLKELLDIEKVKADAEKKAATAEKNRATAAWKIVKEQKSKANDERIEAKAEKEKAEGYRTLLESLKKELDDTRLKFASEAAQFEHDKKKLEAEMQRAAKQKTNVDKERKKTTEQKQLADLKSKLALEEKQRADRLDKQLAEEKIRVDGLREEIHQLKSSVKSNELSTKTISPKGDFYKMNTNSNCVNIETINNKKRKSKKRDVKEGKQVDKSMAVSVVNEMPKKEILQLDSSKSSEIHPVSGSERVKFLNKQLKFEKLQTKHAMKTAELEKNRTRVLCRELSCLKQEFVQFLFRMDIIEGHYSLDTEGINDLAKIPLQAGSLSNTLSAYTKKSKLFHVPPSQFCIEGKHDLVVCGNIKQVIKDNSPSLKPSYCNCSNPLPSNASKFRSPSKGNRGKRMHNSAHAIDSSTASFSDPQMAGSQNKGCFSVLTSTEFSPGKEKHVDKMTNENGKQATAISKKMGRANKKRKKAPDMVESEHEHARGGKGLGLQTEEALNGLPNICINGEASLSELRDKGVPNQAGNYKRRKKAYKQDETTSAKEPVIKVTRNADDLLNICLDNCKKSLENSHGYGIDDMHMNDLNLSTCFADYMKLLELDSASEEERCRNVIETPLSPTIPDIKFPDYDILEHKSSEEPFNEVTTSKEQWLSPSYNSNVIKGAHENVPQKVFQEVHNSHCSSDNSCDKSCDDCNTVHVQEVHTFNGIENTHKITSITHTKYIIVSPDLKNTFCVSRIYCAARACAAKYRVLSDSGTLMADILSYLTTEDHLSPREKASTLFTVLFNHYVLFVLSATGDFCSSSWLSSCSSHFHLAFSEGIKSIFTEQCDVDSFFVVVDSFFTNREVLKHKDAAEINLAETIATGIIVSFNFEETYITFCPELALPVHTVGGSIILTLVCEALDRYSFMCEASYKILHLNKFDSELKLSILHVFSNVCGKKYLESSHNVLIMTVIKSLVTFIEKEMSAVSDHTSSKTSSIFSPCDNCLFAEGALSVDDVVLLLLEKIKRRPFGFCDLSLNEKECRGSAHEQGDLFHSCFLQDLEMKTIESDCCIVDFLSLLEIIALKMSWEWTYLKIVSPLFEIMESPKNNGILALVATLLGEVGRMGVESRGYADAGVHQLRHRLLLLMGCGDKSWFHIHIAAAQALLTILPFNSQQLYRSTPVCMDSDLTPLNNWFSSLSSQQRCQISSFCQI